MDEPTSTKQKRRLRWLTVVFPFLCLAVLIFEALLPYLQGQRPVSVTITDEANQLVAGANITIVESDLFFFGVRHIIRNIFTDSFGKAQFTVKGSDGIAIFNGLNGQPVRILSYQTNDSLRGPGRLITVPFSIDFPSRNVFNIQWGAIDGLRKISFDTTVVVSTAQPK